MRPAKAKELPVINEFEIAYGIVMTAVVSFISWDKKNDKKKIDDNTKEITELKVIQARQDERHKALVDDVGEIKDDTKEIKRMLMEKK